MTKITDKLRGLLDKYDAKFGSQEMKFMDAKLIDGVTVVRFPSEELKKGDVVTVITEQGELPLPDSEVDMPYVLENGTTFSVVNGLIDVVVVPEEVAPIVEDVTPTTEEVAPIVEDMGKMDKPKRVIKSQVEEHIFSLEIEGVETITIDFSSMFKASNDKIEKLENENKSLVEKFNSQNEVNKELATTIELIADEPSKKSQESIALKSKSWNEMSPIEKFRASKL
jgi:hypothetical protein